MHSVCVLDLGQDLLDLVLDEQQLRVPLQRLREGELQVLHLLWHTYYDDTYYGYAPARRRARSK